MDKRTIIAFVLIGVILILTQTDFYKKRVIPEQPINSESTFFQDDTLRDPELVENQEERKKEVVIEKPKITTEQQVSETKLYTDISDQTVDEKEIKISTPLYQAIVSNHGGGLISWKLQQFIDADSQLVEILPNVETGQPSLGFIIDRDSVLYNEINYQQQLTSQYASNEVVLNENRQTYIINYFIQFEDGRRISKEYTFYSDRYDFDLNVNIEGFSDIVDDKSYQLVWNASFLPIETPIREDVGQYKLYAYLGEDLQDFNVSENDKEWKIEEIPGTVNWTALRTKYFLSALVPMDNKGRSVLYKGIGIPYLNERFKYYEYAISMPLSEGRTQQNLYKLYLGPLEYNTLKKLDLKLDKLVMSSGGYERLFRPFSIIILISLKFLHKFISNYGLVIILFSILIKLLLYPLTHKSYVSMKKMQMVQPLMTELREKHKGEPQVLNKKMMELYKTYGVNPMGGCLPMLLQMPLLIGLFIVFRSTIELRGADFIWWITDLSKPDSILTLPFTLPLYGNKVGLLPVVMGLTMFLQQKSTMQDPRQKMMMYFMPVFFVLLFNTFPSGLNLYYTLFNLWTIIQQKFVKTDAIELKPKEKKPDKKRKGKK
jgi:YidC/Oxa1 family membrane protein insertase